MAPPSRLSPSLHSPVLHMQAIAMPLRENWLWRYLIWSCTVWCTSVHLIMYDIYIHHIMTYTSYIYTYIYINTILHCTDIHTVYLFWDDELVKWQQCIPWPSLQLLKHGLVATNPLPEANRNDLPTWPEISGTSTQHKIKINLKGTVYRAEKGRTKMPKVWEDFILMTPARARL